ncbi:hypothetical protein PS467_37395 [Streptomyces luomodiensis]|uniref:Secreted protein n=1 Tax=Streptomyces luomodiensis TaxID=3026192 RepID=A0ABY9V703_9ACTN|nr:hypothetical protein [Streptomyces sp. SCA4-21]WNF00604.1 hypothetical protein PS467_37395 [Streptomyces sp. SCA4-21]
MQIAKKAALLAATAGALALLGTGTAAANGGGSGYGGGYGGGSDRTSGAPTGPTNLDVSTFIFQSNKCDTNNGSAWSVGGLGPSGDINIGATCLNHIGG